MDGRQQRGILIAKAGWIRQMGDSWIVPSQSSPTRYTVRVWEGGCTCTCPDFEERRLPCKHVFAVEHVWHRHEEIDAATGETTVTETESVRVTYSQNWPRYNAAQCAEKAVVQRLLAGLCEGIEQPLYNGRGRPPMPLADVIYGLVMKVYTGMSARRADTDVRECEAMGFVDKAPAYNSVLAAMLRPDLAPILTAMIEASALPLAAIETDFSVDATGFSTTTYDRWFDKKWGREKKRQQWVKAHAMVGNETNIITSIVVTEQDEHDAPHLPHLLQRTTEGFDVRAVQGDKAYLSVANLAAIESVGAVPYVPFKLNSTGGDRLKGQGADAWRRMWHAFQFHREDFLARYHRRSNVESTFSALKRKFGSSVRARKRVAQVNEVLAKALCYNLSVVTHSVFELGIDPGIGLETSHSTPAQELDSLPGMIPGYTRW